MATFTERGSSMDYSLSNMRSFKEKTNEDLYVTSLDINFQIPNPWIAVGLSNKSVEVINMESLKTVSTVKPKGDVPITSVKFSKQTSHELYCSSEEGNITLWDLRQNSVAKTFKDPEESKVKPINCFDVSNDERFLVGGTDLVGSEAYLLFWDRRSSKILGGYWESHTDDILDVGYHPTKNNILMSGSTDGLVNIFDLSKDNEDDALLNTLNSEKTVAKCKWLRGDYLSCITHNEDLQVWDSEEVEQIGSFNREDVSRKEKMELDYFIDTIQPISSCLDETVGLFATGSNKGSCQLWSLNKIEAEENKATLKPWTILMDGHQDVVRCIGKIRSIFVTGGEDGAICLWKEQMASDYKIKSALKENLHLRNKRPY